MTTAKWINAAGCVMLMALASGGCVAQSKFDDANRKLAAAEVEVQQSTDELTSTQQQLAETKIQLTKVRTDLVASNQAHAAQTARFNAMVAKVRDEMVTMAGRVEKLTVSLNASDRKTERALRVTRELESVLGAARGDMEGKDRIIDQLTSQIAGLKDQMSEPPSEAGTD